MIKISDIDFDLIKKGFDQKFTASLWQWNEMCKLKPKSPQGYVKAAYIYLDYRKYKQAEAICLEGINNCEYPNLSLQICFADIKTWQRKYPEALERWAEVRRLFPNAEQGYRNAAIIYRELGLYELAEHLCRQGIDYCDNNLCLFKLYTELAYEKNMPEYEKLKEILNRQGELCRHFPENNSEQIKLANVCKKMAKYEPTYSLIYNTIISTIFRTFNGEVDIKEYEKHKNSKIKICFIGHFIRSLRYYSQIIKYINPCLIDCIIKIKTARDQEYISSYGLEAYNISYGYENIQDYDYIITPDLTYGDLDDIIKRDLQDKFIFLHHSIERSFDDWNGERCALAINEVQNEVFNETLLDKKTIDNDNKEFYRKIPQKARCEIAHTGLYHINKCMVNPDDRRLYKWLMKEKLGCDIDNSKPVVILLEDAEAHAGQTVYCLNKLCDSVNIIFKPLLSKPIFSRLNPKVIIYEGKELPWSEMRYAVDFILAGYKGGTLISSLLLGLDVIPYYSRIEFTNSRGRGKIYDHFRSFRESDPNWVVHFIMRKYLKYFDLLKPDEIIKAITGNEYRKWYHKILPELQREAFGDYARIEGGGAARLTAEYIMRFVYNGTLGDDCGYIYLKDKYFNKSHRNMT